MKNKWVTPFAIRIVVFYFSLAVVCQSIQAQPELRFRLVNGTVIVVSLLANDKGPFDFVLDTGTDTTLVDPTLARQLSLAPIDQLQLNTLAGSQTLTRSALGSLAAGPDRVEHVEVLVQNLSELRKLDSQIEGIAGQNFLSHFNYLIDYRKRSLWIETGNEIVSALEGDRVHLEIAQDKMMVESEAQSLGHAKLRLLLDSATNSLVLIHRSSQGLNVSNLEDWLVTSVGQTGLQVGRVQLLMVGSQQFHDIPAALTPSQASDAERIEDGLLPTALFHGLYVNNRDAFVVFNPRVKKN